MSEMPKTPIVQGWATRVRRFVGDVGLSRLMEEDAKAIGG